MSAGRDEAEKASEDFAAGLRLDSWKEIAAYLKRDLRTVQRWEKSEGLPVHRHVHNKLSTVYAYASELNAWQASRRAEVGSATAVTEKKTRIWRSVWVPVLTATLAVIITAVWRLTPRNTPTANWKSVPITVYPGVEQHPSFSPDGNQIAFTWNGDKQDQFDVYVKLLDAGTALRLTNDPAEELFPTWSPDGRWIAYLRTVRGTNRTVHIVSALGGPERTLGEVDGPLFPAFPSPFLDWAKDSKGLVVVSREQPDDPLSLFFLSLESGTKHRLTTAPSAAFDSSPAVSPDGRAVAFVRLEHGAVHGVYVQPLAEDHTAQGQPRRLTAESWGVSNLSWAGDGKAIFCSNYKEDGRGLWKISLAGGPAEQVSLIGDSLRHLRVSRQGDRLVYSQENLDSDIWRLDLGRPKQPATRLISSTRKDFTPHVSPDGKRVAYVSYRSGHSEVWVSNTDGSETQQLTSFNGPLLLNPRWKPDGSDIAFSGGSGNSSEIYIVSANGGTPRQLTSDPARDILPDWSPDGRWIFFTSGRNRHSQDVWKIPAAGGEALQVSRHGAIVRSAFLSPDGKHVYYKVGNPIGSLWRVPSEGGVQERMADSVYRRNFEVVDGGIYFMSEVKPASAYVLHFFDFRDRRVKPIAEIVHNVGAGMSVSRDRRYILYWAWEQRGSDIVMVENFLR